MNFLFSLVSRRMNLWTRMLKSSTDGGRTSRVLLQDAAGQARAERQMAAPPFFVEGPPVLGVAGIADTSYFTCFGVRPPR